MSGHSKIACKWSARHRYFPFNALLLKHSAGPNSSHRLLRAKQIKENYWCAAKCLMLNDKTIILSALITNIKMFFWEVIVRPQCDEIQILNINSLLSLCMCYGLHRFINIMQDNYNWNVYVKSLMYTFCSLRWCETYIKGKSVEASTLFPRL